MRRQRSDAREAAKRTIRELLGRTPDGADRTAQDLAAALAAATKTDLKADTAARWMAGRQPGEFYFRGLVAFLGLESQEQRLRDAYAALAARRLAVAEQPLDQEDKVQIYYLPDFYQPFSGTKEHFVDDVLYRAFELADIDIKPAKGFETPGRHKLDMPRRLKALESGQAHLLVNLVTLTRMRKLAFFETPVHVSLNGVALDHPDDDRWPAQLEEARRLLAGLPPGHRKPRESPFQILTIEGEVGYKYVERLIVRVPSLRRATPVDTLAPDKLTTELVKANAGRKRTILLCDEVTALRVRGCFGHEARLLYPLTTERSVLALRTRRAFPHHALGIAYGLPRGAGDRQADADDERVFSAILTSFIGLEVETTAVKYQELYSRLVRLVRHCLAQSPELYVGGVRKIVIEQSEQRTWYERALIDQSARSYAFRCLQLSQRAADGYHQSNPWTPMLVRARQRVIQAECRQRKMLRASLRSAISAVAGLSESSESLTRDDFRRALCEHGRQLVYILERDFEVRLPGGSAVFREHANESFERFLSFIQEQLEIASGDTDVIVIGTTTKKALADDPVAAGYDAFLQSDEAGERDLVRYQHRTGRVSSRTTIVKATSLGETVGLMWMQISGARVELLDLFVAEHMRGSRTSQLFIREAIERAREEVSIPLKLVPKDRRDWFKNMGFALKPRLKPTDLSYQCYMLTESGSGRPSTTPPSQRVHQGRRQALRPRR